MKRAPWLAGASNPLSKSRLQEGGWSSLLLGGVVALAFLPRAWGLLWGLKDATVSTRPHPDEWVVYWVTHWFAQHGSLNPCPSLAHHQCFFDWGGAYLYASYLMTPAAELLVKVLPFAVLGHADHAFVTATLAGRLVSLVASTLTPLAVYGLGRQVGPLSMALISAVLAGAAALLIQLAHFATPDSLLVLLVTLALLSDARAVRLGRSRDFALSGAVTGLAIGTEYHMLLLLVPLGCVWVLRRDRSLRSATVALLTAGGTFAITNPYALVEAPAFVQALQHALLTRTVGVRKWYGNRFVAFDPAPLYVLRFPLGYGVGFITAVWLALGFLWSLARRNRADLLLLSWVIPYGLLVTLAPEKFIRYSAPLLPALFVLGARLSWEAWQRQRILAVAAATLATAAVAFEVVNDAAYVSLFSRPNSSQLAVSWLSRHAHRPQPVLFDEIPDGLLTLPYWAAAAGYTPCFAQFDPSVLRDGPRYLLTDSYALEEHPRIADRTVGAFASRLRSNVPYRRVLSVESVPTALGMTFPINNAPHDWRYPQHAVAVYERLNSPKGKLSACYPSLDRAIAALYVPQDTTKP